jgi:lipopolysaccharide export system permease protein
MTYLADTGRVVEAEDNTLLVMTNGTIQRMERPQDELTVVAFDAYAFDLTDLTGGPVATTLRPSERTLFELLAPRADDTDRAAPEARLRIELHDRLSQPLAPFVYALVVSPASRRRDLRSPPFGGRPTVCFSPRRPRPRWSTWSTSFSPGPRPSPCS